MIKHKAKTCLRWVSQSHRNNLRRGSEVRRKKMVMKRYINIGLSQARLRCKNGFRFPHQDYCQTISLSLSSHFSSTQTDTHIQTEREREKRRETFFLRQIIKLQLHGAAYVMCFSMLGVIFQDWRILKHLHSLGHSAVKIIGKTLINLPWNQLKSEQNNSASPKGGWKRLVREFQLESERQKRDTDRKDQQSVFPLGTLDLHVRSLRRSHPLLTYSHENTFWQPTLWCYFHVFEDFKWTTLNQVQKTESLKYIDPKTY